MAPLRETKPGFPCRPVRDARSAEWELMNALSLTPNAREHGFQMYHYRDCAGDPLMSWRCELLSLAYFSLQQQREVGAAPHRGNANRPLKIQGKANPIGTQPNKRRAANQSKKTPPPPRPPPGKNPTPL
ncbi:hypothetical protein R75483_01403 [Paraburkholderia domus]|nr:hypothetical protein R75483_01403 [Paraburkholderia domus]